ncbi:MAG: hypothetical protein WB930_16100 [Syntrophobacteraceae bacterium]
MVKTKGLSEMSNDEEKRRTDLAQVLNELDQLEREMSTRLSLMRRRLKAALGAKRTAGAKVFTLRSPNGWEREITMRGLGEE